MKTYSKSLLIAVAALAVTTTGAYAHSGLLSRLELSEEQRAALQVAHELRQDGDLDAARDILLQAGFDEETLEQMRERTEAQHERMLERFEDELSDEQFDALQVAHAANDKETAWAILEEAGIERPLHREHHNKHHNRHDWDEAGVEE